MLLSDTSDLEADKYIHGPNGFLVAQAKRRDEGSESGKTCGANASERHGKR